jgi:imidazolonepropionase-like amidohydrolase
MDSGTFYLAGWKGRERTVRALRYTRTSALRNSSRKTLRRAMAAGASGVEMTCCLLLDMFRISDLDERVQEGLGRLERRSTGFDRDKKVRGASMQDSAVQQVRRQEEIVG